MQALLWGVLTWFLRAVVVKFLVMAVAVVVVSQLLPIAGNLIASFVSSSSLTSAWAALTAGEWFFLDFFRLDVGVPLVVSAYIARFLIRRIPFIG